jgi:catechol 2,3-dioxygenase-like lactoylglutathione lyase family enzyme
VKLALSLDHLNFSVADFLETAKWYNDIFDFNIVEHGNSPDGQLWGILKNGNTMLCVYEMKEKLLPTKGDSTLDKFHRISHFGLKINDRLAWEKILKDKDLVVLYGGQIEYPYSTSWYIQDPSGHEIEVSIWKNDQIQFPDMEIE